MSEKKVDSLKNSISQKDLDQYSKFFHYEYIDKSIWKRWKTKESKDEIYSPIYMDFSKSKEYYYYPREGLEEYPFIFEKIKNLKIQKFKRKTKIINGIKCFQIKCAYTIVNEKDEGFPELDFLALKDEKIESTMWVTEQIKSIHHPTFKVKEILEKFYPLIIEEKNSTIEGRIRKYSLNEIK